MVLIVYFRKCCWLTKCVCVLSYCYVTACSDCVVVLHLRRPSEKEREREFETVSNSYPTKQKKNIHKGTLPSAIKWHCQSVSVYVIFMTIFAIDRERWRYWFVLSLPPPSSLSSSSSFLSVVSTTLILVHACIYTTYLAFKLFHCLQKQVAFATFASRDAQFPSHCHRP